MREIQDIIYPVSLWVVKFDFCQDCYKSGLNGLLSNQMLMQMEKVSSTKKNRKQGKEILN